MPALDRCLSSILILLSLAAPALAQYPDPTIITRPQDWTSPDPRNRLNPFNPLNDDDGDAAAARASREAQARALLTPEEARSAVPQDAVRRIEQARADIEAAGRVADSAAERPALSSAIRIVDARREAMRRESRLWTRELLDAAPALKDRDAGRSRAAARRVVAAAELLRRLDGVDERARDAAGRLETAMLRDALRRLKDFLF